MTVRLDRDAVHYQSMRVHKRAAPAEFNASYEPSAPAYHAVPRTLDLASLTRFEAHQPLARYQEVVAWPIVPSTASS
jgi:hypothetical protein